MKNLSYMSSTSNHLILESHSVVFSFIDRVSDAHRELPKLHTRTLTHRTHTSARCNLHQSEALDVLFAASIDASEGKQAVKIWSREALSLSFKGNHKRCSRELMTCQPTQWDVMHFKHMQSS